MTRKRAAIYLRISLDRTGDELGVERQRKECRRIARERGWTIVEEYTDNSRSAYAKNVARPSYDRLVRDYAAGRFDALVVWDLDRLTRQPRQLEDWIDAAEGRGLVIVTVDGSTDLGTETGRQFARIKAAIARGEIEHRSKRQRAANDQRAEQGRPFMGRRAFGYANGGMEIVESEAEEYRRAMRELLDGSPLRSIARGMNERGAVTTAGNPWESSQVRTLLRNPRHAGLRVHRGEVVGKGKWPAIIDEDTHRAAVAILSDPDRQPKGRPRRYLLSGVARCGLCGGRIYGRQEHRGALYVCESAPHMGRKIEPVDDYVSAVIMARLSQPDALSALATPDNSDRLEELRGKERSARARLDGLSEAFAAGDIDRQQLAAGTKRLRAQLDIVGQELNGLIAASTVSPLLGAEDAAEAWSSLEVTDQRAIIDLLATVTVHPPGRGARTFRSETVGIKWRGSE